MVPVRARTGTIAGWTNMTTPEIESGKIFNNDETRRQLSEIEKILGTDHFIVLKVMKGQKCQNPTCERDHMMAMVAKASLRDMHDALHLIENMATQAIIRKEGGLPSPFTHDHGSN